MRSCGWDPPAKATAPEPDSASLAQGFEEALAIPAVPDDRLPPIPATHHEGHRTIELDPQTARPMLNGPKLRNCVSMMRTDPFSADDFSANGAAHTSPGQRPGYASPHGPALKGRHNRCLALSGLGFPLCVGPRALPWADVCRPFGAAEGRTND